MTPPAAARRVDRGLYAFYAVVAAIALAGQAGAAVEWLHWWPLTALAAVAAVEFGGIVLSAYADHRRQLGEGAYTARVLSAAVAAGAVALNWRGHHDHLQGGFFAGMSALGYAVWLLHSSARRRDQLRADGKLPDTPPAYGLWQWCRHPWITRRARALALANSATRAAEVSGKPPGTLPSTPVLGLYGSLEAARAAVRAERRQAAVSAVLRRKIEAGTDPLTAEIAVTVYDLDEIAARLAAAADYGGLTALIAADLAPDRLAAPASGATTDTASLAAPEPAEVAVSATATHTASEATAVAANTPPATPPRRSPRKRAPAAKRAAKATASDTAKKVARWHARMPDATNAELADKARVSVRSVERYRPATQTASEAASEADTRHVSDNGGPVPAPAVADTHQPADAPAPASPN